MQLNITVEEKSTGYVEKTSRLLTVAQSSVNLQLIPEGPVFKPGLPFSFLIVTETPDNQPVDAEVTATVTYSNSKFETIKTDEETIKTVKGKAILDITTPGTPFIYFPIDKFPFKKLGEYTFDILLDNELKNREWFTLVDSREIRK